MAINSRTAAVIGGGLLGAYTSDITDNPLTGLVSTAISAGVGGMMILPERDVKRMADVVTGVKQDKTSLRGRADSGLTKESESLRSKFIDRLNSFDQFKDNAPQVQELMKYNMRHITDFEKDSVGFVNTLKQLDDDRLIKQLMPLLSDESFKSVNTLDTRAGRVTEYETTIKGNSNAEKIDRLAKIFEKKMGNSIEEAHEKAAEIVNRSTGLIKVRDGTVTIGDINDNGKQVTIPITGYDSNQVRYHNAGNGKATSVKGFTPYALDFAEGRSVIENGVERRIGFNELKRGMAPEMMLKFLGKDAPISSILPDIKSLFQYDAREVGNELFTGDNFQAKSPSFINNSNQTDYSRIRNLDLTGKINPNKPLRDLQALTDDPNKRSEVAYVRSELAYADKSSHTSSLGVSSSTATTLQSGDMHTISMFPPMERNVSGSVLRDTEPTNKTLGTKALHEVFGDTGSKSLYSSAQVVSKLDVMDAEAFNKVTSIITGDNSKVLGDGFGLFNMAHDKVLSNRTMSDIVIPRGNGTLISHPELAEALSGNVSEYLQKNGPISIGQDSLGYDKFGKELKLGNQYSSGQIESAFINKSNDLVLRTKSVFNPNEEGLVKFFSVGSKALAAGVEEDNFRLLTALGSLMNEGKVNYAGNRLNITDNDLAKRYGTSLTNKQMQALAQDQQFLQNHGRSNVTLITDATKTGMSDLQKFVRNDGLSSAEAELIEKAGINKLIKDTGKRASSVITGYLTFETKAAEDLTAHLTAKLIRPLQDLKHGRKEDVARIQSYAQSGLVEQDFLSNYSRSSPEDRSKLLQKAISSVSGAFRSSLNSDNFINTLTKDNAMSNLHKFVDASGIADDIQSGFSSAVGSTHRGSSMVGAGNAARMSWNANKQLKDSGFTREQLSWFGKTDEGIVYELLSLTDESKRGRNSINSSIRGREKDVESILSNGIPETRLNRLQTAVDGFDMKGDYLTYDLNFDKSSTKSLNFGIISTNRGGKYEFKDTEIIKKLDKYRLDIMSLDISLNGAEKSRRKVIEDQLMSVITEYEGFKKSAFSGDNNLLKNAASLYSDKSAITVAQPIGGAAQKFIEDIEFDGSKKYKDIANHMFISEDGLSSIAEKVGIKRKNIVRNAIGNTGLTQVGYNDAQGKFVPFSALVTREPAQGALSSEFMELILDPSIKGGSKSLYAAPKQYGWTVGKSGDFDQDTIQTLYSKLSREEFDSMSTRAATLREEQKPYLNQQKEMSPKGVTKAVSSLSDFKSPDELNSYMITADYKGKVRKIFAPMATTLASNYTAAIALDVGSNKDKLTLGRIATYKSVENLLKSSHIDTKNFMNNSQDIEKLKLARDKFITSGDAGQYKGILQSHLPGVLGFGASGNAETDRTIMEAVDLITGAEVNHARSVSRQALTPMDMNTKQSKKGFESTLFEIMDNLDMFDLNKGIDIKRSPSQLYNNLNDAIVESVKKNKNLLLAGGAALVGVNLLGRSEPSFSDSRANMRQHSSQMLQTPTDPESVQTGIETNKTKSNYIQPNSYNNSKSVQVQGDFVDQGYNNYNQFNSALSPNIDPSRSLSSAIYGGDIRSARLELSDL